jgi:hypothetical protein
VAVLLLLPLPLVEGRPENSSGLFCIRWSVVFVFGLWEGRYLFFCTSYCTCSAALIGKNKQGILFHRRINNSVFLNQMVFQQWDRVHWKKAGSRSDGKSYFFSFHAHHRISYCSVIHVVCFRLYCSQRKTKNTARDLRDHDDWAV